MESIRLLWLSLAVLTVGCAVHSNFRITGLKGTNEL